MELDNSLIYDVKNIFQQTVAHKGSSKISKMQVMKYEGGNIFYKNSALEEDLSAVNARFKRITRLVIKVVNEEVGRVIAKKKGRFIKAVHETCNTKNLSQFLPKVKSA